MPGPALPSLGEEGPSSPPPAPPLLTPGPQRGPLVTQQISVWQTVQRIQSQPSFFWTMMRQVGQCMASPICTRVCEGGGTGTEVAVRDVGTPSSPPRTHPTPRRDPHLQHVGGLPGGRVVLRLDPQVVLVLAAVLPFVDGLGGCGDGTAQRR